MTWTAPCKLPIFPLWMASTMACGALMSGSVTAGEDETLVVDLGGFGSGEPVEDRNLPDRGQLVFTNEQATNRIMEHWDQYDWSFEAERPGTYRIVLRHRLRLTNLGVQLHHADSGTRLRALLRHTESDEPAEVDLGIVKIEDAGPTSFSVYTPTLSGRDQLIIEELRWIPTTSHEPLTAGGKDRFVLSADAAVVWSEKMHCRAEEGGKFLGNWSEKGDLAEWTLRAPRAGAYDVVGVLACPPEAAGSEVALEVNGEEKARFEVPGTGEDGQWQRVSLGRIGLSDDGEQAIMLRPVTKPGRLVMRLARMELIPAD